MFEIQAEEKRIGLTLKIGAKVPQLFKTDPLRLRQILMNLLSNALKFTVSGSIDVEVSYIEDPFMLKMMNDSKYTRFSKTSSLPCKSPASGISGDGQRPQICIKVKDTGIGMNEEESKQLFKKFAVLESSRKFNNNGLGLGLYLSKRILEQLGGNIICQSERGVGTQFILTFEVDPRRDISEMPNPQMQVRDS